MTYFPKLFIVKINKMIKNKTGASFLVVYVMYGSLVYTDSKKTVSCLPLPPLPPTAGFIPSMQLLKGNCTAHFYIIREEGGSGCPPPPPHR